MKKWLDEIWHRNGIQIYAIIKNDVYKDSAIMWKKPVMRKIRMQNYFYKINSI